jgi:hypothetical protein
MQKILHRRLLGCGNVYIRRIFCHHLQSTSDTQKMDVVGSSESLTTYGRNLQYRNIRFTMLLIRKRFNFAVILLVDIFYRWSLLFM